MRRLLLTLALASGFLTVLSGYVSAETPHFGRMAFWHHTSPSHYHGYHR